MDWNADTIRALRERLGLTKTDFGRILYGPGPDQARRNVWRLETGARSPTGSLTLTLDRLDQGILDPEQELSRIKDEETVN